MSKEFKVGQSVVHLSHGVGVVKGIEKREFSPGKMQKFYILDIQDNGALKKVFVPFETASERIRHVMDKKTALEVLSYIESGKADTTIDHQTWNRRYREYMDLIHTGDALNVAKVLVALQVLGKERGELSFGERKLLDQARELLNNEFNAIGLNFTWGGSLKSE